MAGDEHSGGRSGIDRRSVFQGLASAGGSGLGASAVVVGRSTAGDGSPRGQVVGRTTSGEPVSGATPVASSHFTRKPAMEATLNVSRDGTLYHAMVREPVGVARSIDGGESWATRTVPERTLAEPLARRVDGIPDEAVPLPPGIDEGRDHVLGAYCRVTPYSHLDHDEGRLFYTSGFPTSPVFYSDDGGRS